MQMRHGLVSSKQKTSNLQRCFAIVIALLSGPTVSLQCYTLSITNDSSKVIILEDKHGEYSFSSGTPPGDRLHWINKDLYKGDSYTSNTIAAYCFHRNGRLKFRKIGAGQSECSIYILSLYKKHTCGNWRIRIYDEGDSTKLDFNGDILDLYANTQCLEINWD